MLSIRRRPITDQERAKVAGWAQRHARLPRPTWRRLVIGNVLYGGLGAGVVVGGTLFILARRDGHSSSMAIIGAGMTMGLLTLYALLRSCTVGERSRCDLEAAEYDKWMQRFDKQLKSPDVEVVEFEADMVWDITRDGPLTYLFRVEPTKFALVELEDRCGIWDCGDKLAAPSRVRLECYLHIGMVAAATASGPHLAVQKRPMDRESLIGLSDAGPLPYRILTPDEVRSAQVRQDLLQGAT